MRCFQNWMVSILFYFLFISEIKINSDSSLESFISITKQKKLIKGLYAHTHKQREDILILAVFFINYIYIYISSPSLLWREIFSFQMHANLSYMQENVFLSPKEEKNNEKKVNQTPVYVRVCVLMLTWLNLLYILYHCFVTLSSNDK